MSRETPVPARRRPPQIRDVARLAGVSHQTVSRVINGSSQVRPETRARVHEAMEELDYRANPVARALTTGRSRTLGVVTFEAQLFGPASALDGIERAARAERYSVSMVGLESLEPDAVTGAVERLRTIGVDGALVIAPDLPDRIALPAAIPVVAVSGGARGVPVVAVDQFRGARLATEHLLGLGHATVHHVAGPEGREAGQRIAGWRAALTDAGAPVPEIARGDWSASSGYALGRDLLAAGGVTAVFAGNDQMALGLLRAAHEAGLHVPTDLSVVGFDDMPESGYFIPPLTTVRQDFDELGRRSLALLLQTLETGEPPETHVTIPPTLVTRASTAPR